MQKYKKNDFVSGNNKIMTEQDNLIAENLDITGHLDVTIGNIVQEKWRPVFIEGYCVMLWRNNLLYFRSPDNDPRNGNGKGVFFYSKIKEDILERIRIYDGRCGEIYHNPELDGSGGNPQRSWFINPGTSMADSTYTSKITTLQSAMSSIQWSLNIIRAKLDTL